MVELKVPYYSQYRDITDQSWKERACGAACLKMALDYVAPEFGVIIPSIEELLEEGVAIKAYTPSHGWVHRGMVFLAHNHGIPAYHEEFRSLDGGHAKRLVELGFKKIISTLDSGKPVIVSVEKEFAGGGSSHQVVLVGYKEDADGVLIYHEPEAEDGKGKSREVEQERFLKHWRYLAIFVG